MLNQLFCSLAALTLLVTSSSQVSARTPAVSANDIPSAPREFRGAWIATVYNIDWPSKKTLTVAQQQSELIRQFDLAREMKLNAIILQVRPAADALYHSELEPWSDFLTGQQGKAPMPFYDPLKFAVEEAHKRGLELHAWFNPYRASAPPMKDRYAPNHISNTQPGLVRRFGSHLWLDPGERGVQDHTFNVVMDVVRRYDIDGVHFDDYFYPYKSYAPGKDFPDDASWQKYQAAGGALSRGDWRRENVNILVKRVHEGIRSLKPHVRFGIAPFGIWKPGFPAGVSGLNAYEELYKDSRKWLHEGWVDYMSPQLYWKISAPKQSYRALLSWWVEQNRHNRHIWPGLSSSSVKSAKDNWPASEIVNQVSATRQQVGSTGNIHYSMKPLMRDQGGVSTALVNGVYRGRALVPASPWLDSQPPAAPSVAVVPSNDGTNEIMVRWQSSGAEPASLWGIYARIGNAWSFDVLPPGQTAMKFPASGPGAPSFVAISSVDRVGNESQRSTAVVGTGGQMALR